MTAFHGTKHDDAFNESSDTTSDIFNLYKGGDDTVIAGSGNDVLNMGASLNEGDRLDGGAGRDVMFLHGDYSAGVAFDDQTIQNIEVLRLGAGFDYNFTTADGNVTAGAKLEINAAKLGAGDSLTFDGSAETDGRFVIYGGAGNDTLTGGAKADVFHLETGGNDTAHGGGGNDTFFMGAAFTSADVIDGGAGNDTLDLHGDYSGGYTFGAAQLTSIEALRLDAGFNYNLITNDGNVVSGASMAVDGSALGAANTLNFNGSAETDGSFVITGGASNDTLTGGAQADTFDLTKGGTDVAHGGGGDDIFYVGSSLTANTIDGGQGNDTLEVSGDYSLTNVLSPTTFTNIETLKLDGGHSYDFQLDNANVAAGQTLTVDTTALSGTDQVAIDGSAETNGHFDFIDGNADHGDLFEGGALSDTFDVSKSSGDEIQGGGGADTIICGGPGHVNVFLYNAVSDSTSSGYDTIENLDFNNALFFSTDISSGILTNINVTSHGTLDSGADFDTDLRLSVILTHLPGSEYYAVCLFTPNLGTLAGHTFLVIDNNASGLYEAGQDLVFDVTGYSGTPNTGEFAFF